LVFWLFCIYCGDGKLLPEMDLLKPMWGQLHPLGLGKIKRKNIR
jgi:hypothetical protein